MLLLSLIHRLTDRLDRLQTASDDGFSTAELLGNAALGVAALAVIWGLMTGLGEQVVTYITGQMFGP